MQFRDIFEVKTSKDMSFIEITDKINSIIVASQLQEGICNIFITATTAGLMINENERMLLEDFIRLFKKLTPEEKLYSHPSNAFSHIRANMLKQDLTIPVSRGKLVLGTWQSIILWEFDIEPRKREIIVTINGA
jgi:secondary thiamine-phosphate synthase enzyme